MMLAGVKATMKTRTGAGTRGCCGHGRDGVHVYTFTHSNILADSTLMDIIYSIGHLGLRVTYGDAYKIGAPHQSYSNKSYFS